MKLRTGFRAALACLGMALAIAACGSAGSAGGPGGGPAAGGAVPASYSIGQIRQQMLVAVNQYRTSQGLGALNLDPDLDSAAQAHAADMAARGVLSHTGSDGSSAGDRVLRVGYRYREYAENIAQGQASVAETVQSWIDSPGHRANMLLPAVADLGVGFAEGQPTGRVPGRFWVIVLGVR